MRPATMEASLGTDIAMQPRHTKGPRRFRRDELESSRECELILNTALMAQLTKMM